MVSSEDVAKRAGVSQSTVSRVLNTPAKVSKHTYEKVVQAMEELHYRPNSVARSLVNQETKSIALISGPLHNPFFTETTTAIVAHAIQKGYHTNVHFENFGDNMSVYNDVLSHQVDGIILSSILYHDSIFDELTKLKIPFMMFNRKHRRGGNYVEMDNHAAAKIAADHLLELGHRDIAWIGGSLEMSTFDGRYRGFMDGLRERDVTVPEELIHITDTSRDAVQKVTESIMARKKRATAIFAATDSIALFIMDYLLSKGYSIPEDISLIGIDNVQWSAHHAFQLTTVGLQEAQSMGLVAIKNLLHILEKQETANPVQITLKPMLFQRKTTKRL